jgi:hypothetical protein
MQLERLERDYVACLLLAMPEHRTWCSSETWATISQMLEASKARLDTMSERLRLRTVIKLQSFKLQTVTAAF